MNKKVLIISIIVMAFIAFLFLLGIQGLLGKKNVPSLESDTYNDMEIIEITAFPPEIENVNVLLGDDTLRTTVLTWLKLKQLES